MICDDSAGQRPDCQETRITETLDSRVGTFDKNGESWELHLYVQGTNDECTVRERLVPGNVWGLPHTFPILSWGPNFGVKDGGNLVSQPLQNVEIRNVGWELWEVRATYAWDGATACNPKIYRLPTNIAMSTRGGNVRITQAIKHVSKFPNYSAATGDVTAPDFDGAIEWDGKSVRGINVPSPMTRYSESWIFSREDLFFSVVALASVQAQDLDDLSTAAPQNKIWSSRIELWEDYTGTVHGPIRRNPYSDTDEPTEEQIEAWEQEPLKQRDGFRQWEPGCVLLDNVDIRQVGLNHFEVTFDFLVRSSYNEPIPLSVDSYDTTTNRQDGWDHLWYYNQQVSETVEVKTNLNWDVTAPQPRFGYVDRIIERRDFSHLGIGIKRHHYYPQPYSCPPKNDLMEHWNSACRLAKPAVP